MSEEILLRQEDYDKIVEEHEYLTSVRRIEVSEHLKEAKSYGDLSENAEYDAAKNEQAELEDRIQKLETMMRNGKIVTEAEMTGDHVNLGLGVRVKDMKTKEEFTYTIVGINQADPFEDKISNESPVGKALLGRKKGETVEIQTENGVLNYKIMEIIKG
ncbi:MAG: transcription elongation factor GreA [Firmicutes bacterium]|jgi:transcription elongation factor GreA|nr:transcription elongation factor GreA [Bacillota bacterium]MCR4724306.1 transcription elongation factor GreA [Clostridia bacterium]MBQ4410049.1 transcription elongation factor GreA [Bacillota bacterium]MBQ6294843.1 transcription elongation factor GreA [Bacillota bacterium]MBR0052066.1 transcription elongation factor GreA [Bacillota bacterium]